MMDYNHWGAIALLSEILPWKDNRVELAEQKDRNGIPVAKVTFNLHENDKKVIAFGSNKVMEVTRSCGRRRGRPGSALRAPGWSARRVSSDPQNFHNG